MRDVGHIAKFNGQNFSLWKFGCWLLLEQHNLVKVVNGEEPIPVEVFLLLEMYANRCIIPPLS